MDKNYPIYSSCVMCTLGFITIAYKYTEAEA